jgi:O-antigen ligase
MLEAALLFAVFFGPLAFGCVEPWSRAILQVVLFFLPLLAGEINCQPVRSLPKSCLLAFGVLFAVGIAQALNPVPLLGPLPLLPFTASAWQTKKSLLLWAAYAALVWAAPLGFANPRAVHRFAWSVVLVGFAVAAIGLVQSAQGNKLILGFREVAYGMSPFGPYFNCGHAASLLAVSALMGLGLFSSKIARVFGGSRSDEALADSVSVLAVLAFLIGIIGLGLISTRNRGALLSFGMVSLIVGFLSCGLLKKPARRWGARAGILILFLCATSIAIYLGILKRGSAASVPTRISMYQSGLRLLADVPLWGTGLGTVITVFAPYKESLVDGVVDHVHNDWLELPLEAGIPAAALMLVALIAFGWRVCHGWMREPSLERRFLMGGGIAAALCFLLHAMVEFVWQIPANAVIFLLTLCWLWSQTGGQPTSSRMRLPAGPITTAVAVIFSLLALRPAVGWALAKGARYDAAFAWDANPQYLRYSALEHREESGAAIK